MRKESGKGFVIFIFVVSVALVGLIVGLLITMAVARLEFLSQKDITNNEMLIKNSVFEARVENFELKTFQLSFGNEGGQFFERVFFLIKFDKPVRILTTWDRPLLSPKSQEFLVDLDNRTYRNKPRINYVEILKALNDHKSRKWFAESHFLQNLRDKDGRRCVVITDLIIMDTEQNKP